MCINLFVESLCSCNGFYGEGKGDLDLKGSCIAMACSVLPIGTSTALIHLITFANHCTISKLTVLKFEAEHKQSSGHKDVRSHF